MFRVPFCWKPGKVENTSKINNPFTDIVCRHFAHQLELLNLKEMRNEEENEKWKFVPPYMTYVNY